ncbi:hypothetical protein [Roseococcus sp. YIM B11640]|uniref:hypothetical protein n=1 Tax=Roseococcus sp. YIM B11640 TaxID=3133973 RepID=UPI003C7A98A1
MTAEQGPGGTAGRVSVAEQLPAATRPVPPMPIEAPPPPPPPYAGFGLREIIVTAFLRRRLMAVALVVPMLLGILLTLGGPSYTAETVLSVLASRDSIGAPDISGFRSDVQSVEILKVVRAEAELMESHDVVRRAMEIMGPLTIYPWLGERRRFGLLPARPAEEHLDRAAELFARALRTDTDASSNILRVRFTSPDRAMAVRALDALLQAYFERRAELLRGENSRILVSELDRYTGELRQIEARIVQEKTAAGVLDIAQDITLAGNRLNSIQERLDRVQEQRATTQAQLAAAQAQLAALPQRVTASLESTNLVSNDETRNTLARLEQERARVASQYAPDWPGLRDLDNRIAAAQATVRASARNTFATRREIRNPEVELLSARIVTLQVEAASLTEQLAELENQRGAAQARSATLLRAEAGLRDLQRRRDGLEVVYRQFTTREAGTRAEEDARRVRSAAVQVTQRPHAPLSGRSLALPFLAVGLLGGLSAAAAAAMALTWLRRVFATPAEAERGLGLPLLAAFPPLQKPADQLADDTHITDLAAQLLDVRINGRRPQIIQLLASGEDDERDKMARLLALEFARSRSRETLLVDLQQDGRAHLAALGTQPVSVERIEGHVIAFNTVIEKLWVTYEAEKSDLMNPRVELSQIQEVLSQLRRAFETVVIIGPDASSGYPERRMAALVDANILVVRGEITEAGPARENRDAVRSAGGRILGLAYTGLRQIVPQRIERLIGA